MKKILAIGASSHPKSINQQWATYVAKKIPQGKVESVAFNEYDIPVCSQKIFKASGMNPQAQELIDKMSECEYVVVSFEDHNGTYCATFKNLLDWAAKSKQKVFGDAKVILLATAPGAGGGSTVLEVASTFLPFMGVKVLGSLSLPSFFDNFEEGRLMEPEVMEKLKEMLEGL